ncbi:MAG TPA: methyltransferase domain-containing protein [Rhizomicrobium sp.]|jgi:SAM-dependent methyltransferase|nr:methyltransferase domain-containing protein [Rhizomicrobium sp.]
MNEDRSYVIGTHAAEIERLGVQHRVWRSRVLDFWRRGGVTQGMTVIDAGAGPGHATLDLAEIVGPQGRVIAIERSRRFLDALKVQAAARGLRNIETVEADLAEVDWTRFAADRLWCRWVLAFVPDAASVVRGMARAVKPDGALLFHEYYDYASWKISPRSAAFEDYIAKIIARWRATGSEPDIALDLPPLLEALGLRITGIRPAVFAATMDDDAARWPMGFAREYLPSMIANGDLSEDEADAVQRALDAAKIVLTPCVLQITAVKSEQS